MTDVDLLVTEAIALVTRWRTEEPDIDRAERVATERLHELVDDPAGVAFTMAFVDRAVRPPDDRVAAGQFASVARRTALPEFLGPIDATLLRLGARLAPVAPWLVMPLARRRMRQLVGHLVVDADRRPRRRHLRRRRKDGFRINVNLLGEAVLGEGEATRRLDATIDLLDDADVDYVSVKISGIAAQLHPWAWDDSLDRISERLRTVLTAARRKGTFVNLDMEEYHDLALTTAAFRRVLDEDAFLDVEAGIVFQAYLPDSFEEVQATVEWAQQRRERDGAGIKIRLVKGANLAMERVDAAMHGWTQAPYETKAETDANYVRCLDWLLTPERTAAVRVGVGSHNLFHVAWAVLLAERRGVADRVGVEMLEGMSPQDARSVQDQSDGVLLYTPVVRPDDFDVAISYLFRRLEENAAPGNFLRDLADLHPGAPRFDAQAEAFRQSVADRGTVSSTSRRSVDRSRPGEPIGLAPFRNEPEADPAVAGTRAWAAACVADRPSPVCAPLTETIVGVDAVIARARTARLRWARVPAEDRRALLRGVADELARSRNELLSAMVHEAAKTVDQADVEICEAIDFARYDADRILDLDAEHATFEPFGVVGVVPPWNFPVAIPTGGVMAGLAAGNAVIVKPAPEVPRCSEVVVEAAHRAGIDPDLLVLLRVPENDVGRHFVTSMDAVVLTGASETARLFQSWKSDLRLFAETSGKNALVISPTADLDLAVKDLVQSAFGHAGQKCSAASLAIGIGGVAEDERFLRQLADAVATLAVGPPDALTTTVGPLIGPPNPRLAEAFTTLEPGESWLVEPSLVDDGPQPQWRPGVRLGVRAGSWFHRTECFGPVLGIMAADDLDEAIAIQNSSAFGLTGGLHSLDPDEIATWADRVEVGNAYVNRPITGAIVQRQPFGGWKASSVGPGAKAGGPGYVAQLGVWRPTSDLRPEIWEASDRHWWRTHFSVEHDPSALFCESNVFRYRPLPGIVVRVGPDASEAEVARVRHAAHTCGVPVTESRATEVDDESFAQHLAGFGLPRVRVIGTIGKGVRTAAAAAGIHLADDPVTAEGRVELRHFVREQSVSTTLHRFGNLMSPGH